MMIQMLCAAFALLLSACAVANPTTGSPSVEGHTFPVQKTEAEWRALLDAEEFRILRQAGTERAFTGKYWNNHEPGVYHCAACGNPVFTSASKFDSGTGWPSFWQPATPSAVVTDTDTSYGMVRTEVLCARCGGHLGHVFNDGPPPTGQRWCINGNALDFEPRTEAPPHE